MTKQQVKWTLSTPYNQWLQEAVLGLEGLENDTGHPLSHPMDDTLHGQREFRIKHLFYSASRASEA